MPGRTARQAPRTPISAKLVANLITEAGADRVLTMELHAGQIQGFFDIPVDNLYRAPLMVPDILDTLGPQHLMIVSPDVGGVSRARGFAKRLDVEPGHHRQAPRAGGRLRGDERHRRRRGHATASWSTTSSTAAAPCATRDALLEAGAVSVQAYVTHGVLSAGAVARVAASSLERLVITRQHPASEGVRVTAKIRVLSVAQLMGEAISRISSESSVSSLFD